MKWIVLALLVLSSICGYTQGRRSVVFADPNFTKGEAAYEQDKYKEAIPLLEQVVAVTPDNQDAVYYLASSYYNNDQMEEAWKIFKELEKLNPNYNSFFYMEAASVGRSLKKWKETEDLLLKYKNHTPKPSKSTRWLHRAEYILNYVKNIQVLSTLSSIIKDPVMLPAPVNSEKGDYLPMLDATGNKLYFTSTRLGGFTPEGEDAKEGDEDLYFTVRTGNTWAAPELLPSPLNSKGNDGAASFSADGQLMIFGACGLDDSIGECDLYFSQLEGDKWSTPQNMGNVVNSSAWDAHSTISADGSKIIFSSDRTGGYGDQDLYLVERNPFGEWGVPCNLGSIVNTPLKESSPFLSQDGKTLYFSSSGHPGLGEEDIFKSVFENGKWSTPENLGRPINTEGRDQYFTIGGSGEKGYFASNRGQTELHLYEVEIPESMRPQPTIVVEGIVTSEKSKLPVGAYVMVEDINSGELIAAGKSNSATGKYLVVLPAGRSYSVSANKEGFFFYSQRFDVPLTIQFKEVKKDIPLKPIEKGAKVVLNNVFFETGKAALSPESRLELQKAIALMRANSSMVIEIGGHTDNVGDDALNMKLSHDRAKSVREYLVNGGIPSARLQAKGYGKLNPVADNATEEGRQANRRTEFIILEF
jgi:outer membrane protein OmpA-like peptidoglycan-associated protein